MDAVRDAPGAPRWSAPATWHITLAFLGDVPGARLAGLLGALGPVVAGVPPMALQVTGAGVFGRRRPRVLWAGVGGDVDALHDVAGRVAAAARHAGVPVEDGAYTPHLTLGRWPATGPADRGLADRLVGDHGATWAVTEVVVWRSHRTPPPPGRSPDRGGYERLAGWPTHQA